MSCFQSYPNAASLSSKKSTKALWCLLDHQLLHPRQSSSDDKLSFTQEVPELILSNLVSSPHIVFDPANPIRPDIKLLALLLIQCA